MSDREEPAATAFVPGHVTGFFTVEAAEDPTRAGSTGAGLTLADGVTVRLHPESETWVELNGEQADVEPVARVLDALAVEAGVVAETPLPPGAGFGVSGAAALGTALAANAAFDRGLSENELVTVAHGAEVQAGTGLGDVVAQARGGIPIRLEPGGPNAGKLDGVPARTRVEYVSFDELPTGDVIGGETDQLSQAGREALSRLVREPTLSRLMYASRRFAREAGLLTERVHDAIRAVSEAGGEASMAMLGETVFALGTGLSDAGFEPHHCGVHPPGATLQDPDLPGEY